MFQYGTLGSLTIRYGDGKFIERSGSLTKVVGFGPPDDALQHYADLQLTTPLILAILHEDLEPAVRAELVALLLEHGADPRATDEAGLTGLEYARVLEREEIVRVLERG